MIEPVYTRFRELIAEVAPNGNPADVLFDVRVDTEGVVHLLDCLFTTNAPQTMTFGELEASNVCPVGMYSRDSTLPSSFTESMKDRRLAVALDVYAASDELLRTDPVVLLDTVADEASAVRLADWYLNTVDRWHDMVSGCLGQIDGLYDDTVGVRARAAVEHYRLLHQATVGHRRTRLFLGMHDPCACPTETVALASLPVFAFSAHIVDQPGWTPKEMERVFALLCSYVDYADDRRGLYHLPSCVVDLVFSETPHYVRSPRFRSLPDAVRETAEALWAPDTEDPLAEFAVAVCTAERLLKQG